MGHLSFYSKNASFTDLVLLQVANMTCIGKLAVRNQFKTKLFRSHKIKARFTHQNTYRKHLN